MTKSEFINEVKNALDQHKRITIRGLGFDWISKEGITQKLTTEDLEKTKGVVETLEWILAKYDI